jgi:hypothetical protein
MALENGSKEWAYHIFKNKDYKRINSTDSIIEAGYDIEKTSDFLLDTYLKFY